MRGQPPPQIFFPRTAPATYFVDELADVGVDAGVDAAADGGPRAVPRRRDSTAFHCRRSRRSTGTTAGTTTRSAVDRQGPAVDRQRRSPSDARPRLARAHALHHHRRRSRADHVVPVLVDRRRRLAVGRTSSSSGLTTNRVKVVTRRRMTPVVSFRRILAPSPPTAAQLRINFRCHKRFLGFSCFF